ncbi:hypothetical protein AAFC00_000418 [Neodothiora populina]|uniref:DUF1682-domain-containing protein n=1 Tax=Neodothiora populina TaxID=2781224 RepID=A0ABR3PCT7_9PEZI
MADIIKGLFGGAKSSVASAAVPSGDADFADFASAPDPSPVSLSSSLSAPPAMKTFGAHISMEDRPFTKWYNVHERVTWSDFKMEAFILPTIILILATHWWGTRANRRRANAWLGSHVSAFESEFASVGFSGRRVISAAQVQQEGLAKAVEQSGASENALKEKSKDVFMSYASGRQNIAFVDVKINLLKRYNPFALVGEAVLPFFVESMNTVEEKVEITAYTFDGKEKDLIPRVPGQEPIKGKDSAYDGFVWAIVHKDSMKRLRDERYDLSLTSTKDHAKLPQWASVMSESAEITETLLTKELCSAVEKIGMDGLESIIISDMPEDAPKTLNDLVPKKRLQLNLRLNDPSSAADLPLIQTFLRLADVLVATGHFRPEVMRRVRTTRDDEHKKIKKQQDIEQAEERKGQSDKQKKEERERKLKGMTAEEQRKFLEREKDKDMRKRMGRMTMKA